MSVKSGDKQGFSLIEVMVALVIILISMLGFYSVTKRAMEGNLKDVIRDEGVKIGEGVINQIRELPFNQVDIGTWDNAELNNKLNFKFKGGNTNIIEKHVRNINVGYGVQVQVNTTNDPNIRQVQVTINWNYRGKNYSHSIATYIYNRII